MPYEVIWEDRGVLLRFWDVITDEELVQCNLDVYSDPKFESMDYELVKFSDSVVFKPSGSSIRRVAEMDAEASLRKPTVVVAIVGSQMVLRGQANQYRIQHEVMGVQWEMSYFKTEEEARQWLAETLD